MLHMDVFRQRLREEHSISAIVTQPNVSYLCKLRKGMKQKADMDDKDEDLKRIDNPAEAPNAEHIAYWKEAITTATIICPREYLKGVKTLCEDRRGFCKVEEYMSNGKVVNMQYDIPLSELVTDFFDTLKSLSQGYASLDYEHDRYEVADIKKVTFYLNGEPVDALTFLVHERRLLSFAKGYARKLKDILPP